MKEYKEQMTRIEALQVIDRTKVDYKEPNTILQGLHILEKYSENLDTDITCDQDMLYAGAFDLVEEMTDEEVSRMAQLGWFEEEDRWAHHV